MARRAPVSLSPSLSSEGLFSRVISLLLFLGLFVRLRLAADLRLEAGGPIFELSADACLEVDAPDAVDLDDFSVVLAVGWGFAVGLAMEADLELMNPASVG